MILSCSRSPLTLSLRLSTPCPLIDRKRNVLGVLLGRPDDPRWQAEVADRAATLLEQVRQECERRNLLSEKQKHPRRGNGPSMTAGSSYGGGAINFVRSDGAVSLETGHIHIYSGATTADWKLSCQPWVHCQCICFSVSPPTLPDDVYTIKSPA